MENTELNKDLSNINEYFFSTLRASLSEGWELLARAEKAGGDPGRDVISFMLKVDMPTDVVESAVNDLEHGRDPLESFFEHALAWRIRTHMGDLASAKDMNASSFEFILQLVCDPETGPGEIHQAMERLRSARDAG